MTATRTVPFTVSRTATTNLLANRSPGSPNKRSPRESDQTGLHLLGKEGTTLSASQTKTEADTEIGRRELESTTTLLRGRCCLTSYLKNWDRRGCFATSELPPRLRTECRRAKAARQVHSHAGF